MRLAHSAATALLVVALGLPLHPRAEDHRVSMANWLFTPKVLTVRVGDRVTWVNDDDSHHLVNFDNPEVASSPNVKPGKEYSAVFGRPGEYSYYCRYHRDYGMVGTLVVQPPAAPSNGGKK